MRYVDPAIAALLDPPPGTVLFECNTRQKTLTYYNGSNYTYSGPGYMRPFAGGTSAPKKTEEQMEIPWWAENSTAGKSASGERVKSPNAAGTAGKVPVRYPMSKWDDEHQVASWPSDQESAWAEHDRAKKKLEEEEAAWTEDQETGIITRMIEEAEAMANAEEERLMGLPIGEEEEKQELERPRHHKIHVEKCVYCAKDPMILFDNERFQSDAGKSCFRVVCDCGCAGPYGTDRKDAANAWHDAFFPPDKHPDFQ